MHSRIIQLSRSPISKDDWTDESKYFDGFVGSIADCVGEIPEENRSYEIEQLMSSAIAIDRNNEVIMIISKEAYFKDRYLRFKRVLHEIDAVSFEEFMNGRASVGMMNINDSYNDKFGIYIDCDDVCGLDTLDSFMRLVNNRDVFYIGNIVDYHY